MSATGQESAETSARMTEVAGIADFSTLVDSEFTDVKFLIGEGSVSGVRALLAFSSPVLRTMLYSSSFVEGRDASPCIRIHGVALAPFKTFMTFLHNGRLAPEIDAEDLCELLGLADRFDVQPLKLACSAMLERHLCLSTAFLLLLQADLYNAAVLRTACLEFIAAHAGRLFAAPNSEREPAGVDGPFLAPASVTTAPVGSAPLIINAAAAPDDAGAVSTYDDARLGGTAGAPPPSPSMPMPPPSPTAKFDGGAFGGTGDPMHLSALPAELLAAILTRDDLDAEEFTLYKGVLRWAEMQVDAVAELRPPGATYIETAATTAATSSSSTAAAAEAATAATMAMMAAAAATSTAAQLAAAQAADAAIRMKQRRERMIRLAAPLLNCIRFAFIPARELKDVVFPSGIVPPAVVVQALAWQLGCDGDGESSPPPLLSPSPLPFALASNPHTARVGVGAEAVATGASMHAPAPERAPSHGGGPVAAASFTKAATAVPGEPAAFPGSLAEDATAAAAAAVADAEGKAFTPRRPKVRKVSPAALCPRKGWTFLPGPKALCPDTHNGGAVLCCDRLFATYGNDGAAGNRLRVVALDSGRESTVDLPFSTRGAVPAADEISGFVYVFEDSDRLHGAGAARVNARTLELEELPSMPARHCRFAGAAMQGGRLWTMTNVNRLTCFDPQADTWTVRARVPGSAALLVADPADADCLWLLHSSGKLRRYGIAADRLDDTSDWPGSFFSLSCTKPIVAIPRIGGGVLLASHACRAWHIFDSLAGRWHRVSGWPEMDFGAHCVYDGKRGRLLFQAKGKSHWQWVQIAA